MARESNQQATVEAAEQTGMHPAVLASGASVILSWYLYFVKGDRLRGIFVGLWPPTFLAFASYFEQARMHKKLQNLTGGRLMDRIESVMQAR